MKALLARTIGVITIMLLASSPSPAEAAGADDECVGVKTCFSCWDAETSCIFTWCNNEATTTCLEP